LSYLNAFNVFHAPLVGPYIIHWDQHGTILHIFHEYFSLNIKMSMPYLTVQPVDASMAGKTEEFIVFATSIGDDKNQVQCQITYTFKYILPGDPSVERTGLWSSNETYVDSPDEREFPLTHQFYGANLTYKA
jgi:hypothetical protein